MELATLFLSAYAVAFSGAVVPGPMFTVTVRDSLCRGAWAGPQVTLGHAIVELLLVAGLALGLSPYLHQPWVGTVIGLAGGGALLWMGSSMLKDAAANQTALQWDSQTGERKGMGPVWSGMLTSISNPYWVLWWVTVGAGYVFMAVNFGWIGLVFFYLGHILADLTWYSLVSFLVASGKGFIGPKVYRAVFVACGLFLLFLAFTFLKAGLTGWQF